MMIEDEDVSDEVATIMRDEGVDVLTSSTPVRVDPANGGRLRLTVVTDDGERQLEGSHLLSAVGHVPNTDALTPDAAGLRLNDLGFIEVDEYLETNVPGVYAMGDVKGGPAFTHLSCMPQVAMLGGLSYTAMANAIFTHPLLAEGLNALFEMFDANVSGNAEPAA